MDGTLVDTEKLWDVSLQEAATRLGGALDEQERAALVGSNMASTVLAIHRAMGAGGDAAALERTAAGIRDRTGELFASALPWRPGAEQLLAAVRAAGLRCALVTSTERGLTDLALRTLGAATFEAVVCGDEVDGRNKPDPEPYLLAARLLGVSPSDCLAIEDSTAGSASARAAGATVLVIPCDAPVETGERTVLRDSLSGLDVAQLAAIHRAQQR
ncbi:MAG: HAD family hydrolase [Sciscionella sp.]